MDHTYSPPPLSSLENASVLLTMTTMLVDGQSGRWFSVSLFLGGRIFTLWEGYTVYSFASQSVAKYNNIGGYF